MVCHRQGGERVNLPKIASLEFESAQVIVPESTSIHKTFAWDYDLKDFKKIDGKLVEVTDIEYVKEWCKKALHTVKNTFIYQDTEYGSEHHSLIGTTFKMSFVQSEYERMIREALLQNDSISEVNDFSFTQSSSLLTVGFSVQSVYGTAREELTI